MGYITALLIKALCFAGDGGRGAIDVRNVGRGTEILKFSERLLQKRHYGESIGSVARVYCGGVDSRYKCWRLQILYKRGIRLHSAE